MNEGQIIQWFPGHMTKTRRQMNEDIALVDAVAEIVDARIPHSSRNPDIPSIIGKKPLIVLLNKADMADPNETKKWILSYQKKGISAFPVEGKTGRGLEAFRVGVRERLSDKLEQYRQKGMPGKSLRVMVVGIPNVGKSTLINRLVGGNKAKAENRPGVTRSRQWFSAGKQLELLDTPGILWPKFDDPLVGERLAFTGAIRDGVLEIEDLAVRLLMLLGESYRESLTERFGELDFSGDAYDLLCQIGKKRGMMIRGGEVDTARASAMLMEEFRSAKLGRITLERAEDYAGL